MTHEANVTTLPIGSTDYNGCPVHTIYSYYRTERIVINYCVKMRCAELMQRLLPRQVPQEALRRPPVARLQVFHRVRPCRLAESTQCRVR